MILLQHTNPSQAVNNVYELPSIEKTGRYLPAVQRLSTIGHMVGSDLELKFQWVAGDYNDKCY